MKFMYTSIGKESRLRSLHIENTTSFYAAEKSWNFELDVWKIHWKIFVWRAIQYFREAQNAVDNTPSERYKLA